MIRIIRIPNLLSLRTCFKNIQCVTRYIHSFKLNKEKSKEAISNNEKKHNNSYVLSLEEALFLSKELGIETMSEKQKILMRSPPFSPDTSPFVLDNFMTSNQLKSKYDKELEATEEEIEKLKGMKGEDEALEEHECDDIEKKNSNDIMSKLLVNTFNRKKAKTFIHDGKEWLEESEGIGTNKRSCAYVYIRRGTGVVKINNEEDFYIRWPYFYNRIDVMEPFYVTNSSCIYDVFIRLRGGGISGQSRAARLAVARALLVACPDILSILNEHDMLYEDLRQKWPKMPGRKKARKMKQWSKR